MTLPKFLIAKNHRTGSSSHNGQGHIPENSPRPFKHLSFVEELNGETSDFQGLSKTSKTSTLLGKPDYSIGANASHQRKVYSIVEELSTEKQTKQKLGRQFQLTHRYSKSIGSNGENIVHEKGRTALTLIQTENGEPKESSTLLVKPLRSIITNSSLQRKGKQIGVSNSFRQRLGPIEEEEETSPDQEYSVISYNCLMARFEYLEALRRAYRVYLIAQRPLPPQLVDTPFESTLPPGEVHPWGTRPAKKIASW